MRLDLGKIRGNLRIAEELPISGQVTGSVVVAAGGKLKLDGKIRGDLTLEPDSYAELRGMVKGNVINQGGTLDVSGMVVGDVRHESGVSVVHRTAVVHGEVVGDVRDLRD